MANVITKNCKFEINDFGHVTLFGNELSDEAILELLENAQAQIEVHEELKQTHFEIVEAVATSGINFGAGITKTKIPDDILVQCKNIFIKNVYINGCRGVDNAQLSKGKEKQWKDTIK